MPGVLEVQVRHGYGAVPRLCTRAICSPVHALCSVVHALCELDIPGQEADGKLKFKTDKGTELLVDNVGGPNDGARAQNTIERFMIERCPYNKNCFVQPN